MADLLAAAFDVPPSAVTLVSGRRSRVKFLRVAGEGLGDRLAALLGRCRHGKCRLRAVPWRQACLG